MINWGIHDLLRPEYISHFTVILQHGFTRHFEMLIENMIISYLMFYVLILVIKPYFLRKGMS